MIRLFSIRMRAARSAEHISGAERISSAEDLSSIATDMIARALSHSRGNPDSIRLAIDAFPATDLHYASLPDITTINVDNVKTGRSAARNELLRAGVSSLAADTAISALANGAAPGGNVMRGAMLIDSESGKRLENDPYRGVRVSRMDMSFEASATLTKILQRSGRDTPQLREALTLAGKVLASPGIVAELCWSDDPDYLAGYVASPGRGYVRIPYLKESGDSLGGRAFFYQSEKFNLVTLTDFLERAPILFTSIGHLHDDEEFSG